MSVRVFCVLVRVLFVSKSVLGVGKSVICVSVRVCQSIVFCVSECFVCQSVLCHLNGVKQHIPWRMLYKYNNWM